MVRHVLVRAPHRIVLAQVAKRAGEPITERRDRPSLGLELFGEGADVQEIVKRTVLYRQSAIHVCLPQIISRVEEQSNNRLPVVQSHRHLGLTTWAEDVLATGGIEYGKAPYANYSLE